MKRIISLALLLFAALALTACGEESDAKTIAVIMPGADHGFLGESIAHAEAATETLATASGYNYTFLISDDVNQQASQIETVIADGVDVVVLWPHNGDELKAAAQQVVTAGIPIIIYDRLITDFDETAELLGDNVTIGEKSGLYFNEYFETELAAGEVNILEFKGDNSSVPMQRSNGFWSTASSNFNLVNEYDTSWSKDNAQTQMETFLNSGEEAVVESIQAIFTHDAEVALGVLAAIESYDGDFNLDIQLVSAVSCPKELLDVYSRYHDLGIDIVSYAFSPAMVVDAIQKGIDVLDGKIVGGQYLIPTEAVDFSNYMTFKEGSVYELRYSIYED